MIITHGPLQLRTFTSDHLELLRTWRNEQRVNRHLINRNFITVDQQQKWYSSLDFSRAIYFIISQNNEPVGLIYAHNISSQQKSFEGSIFIGNSKYENSFIPIQAVLLLMLFFFNQLEFNTALSTVHKNNKNALDLDLKLGYKVISSQNDFIKSQCSKEDFLLYSSRMLKVLLNGGNDVKFELEQEDVKYRFLTNWVNDRKMKGC